MNIEQNENAIESFSMHDSIEVLRKDIIESRFNEITSIDVQNHQKLISFLLLFIWIPIYFYSQE